MPQSLSKLYVHLVFSTKQRELLLGFSVSPAEVDSVAAYIEGQEEHHRVMCFQDEYRKFLQDYGVEYDERYVWD